MRVNDEGRITPEEYIGVITDALSLRKNVCLMRNFQSLQRPVVGQHQFIGKKTDYKCSSYHRPQ